MITTSARLLALLSLLQVRREWTGRELADRLEVGPRTIRRDVEKLRVLGYPVEAAPGVAGGYRLGAGGELPPLLLDDAEAVAVAVGLRSVAVASIEGIEETSVQALAKLEQVLPARLRRRVAALGGATSSFGADGPRIDPELLATLAGACRDGVAVRFGYVAKDERSSQRHAEPAAVVHTGYRWYLLAYDRDRDDWRTFRLDRIQSRPRLGERARRRPIPGGDASAFVRRQLRAQDAGQPERPPGRVRLATPAARVRSRVSGHHVSIEPDGEQACILTTRGPWSQSFLVWLALLDEPFEILEPAEMADAARRAAGRLSAAIG
jgi:predicted DNA-binding transcriptional regulator YafY